MTCARSIQWRTRKAKLARPSVRPGSGWNLVLEAKFLRDDLPYFVELLGEVASSTKYLRMLLPSVEME